jgi:DNA replication protein DnaC
MSPGRQQPMPAPATLSDPAAEAAIHAACRILQLPTIRDEAAAMADTAVKQRLTHKAFLAEVLTAECDERDARRRLRRVNEAKFPRTKRLTDFDTTLLPDLPAATLAHLAAGGWIDKGEPLVLLGDSGTGKTHCETGGRRSRHGRRG